jgi:Ca2+-binding RTX toxin-like protein
MPLFAGFNLFTGTRVGPGLGSGDVTSFSREPSDLGINPANGTVFVSDDDKDRIFIVAPGPDGIAGTTDDTVSNIRMAPLGSTDPEGVVYDSSTGHLFVSDGAGVEIYRINPVNGVFGDGNDTVTNFDVAQYGAGDCEGLGIDPARNTLLCVDPSTPDNIYELDKGGALVRVLSMADLPTSRAVVADVTMAPTSDPSDSPSAQNYWIADRHLDNGQFPDENDGLLYEMHLESTPPETTITSGPPSATNDPTPTFGFSSSESNSSFECKVDSGAYAACSSPSTVAHVADGTHTFSVRAMDEVGNVDPSPATRTFTVRTAEVRKSGSTLVVTAAPGAKDNLSITKPSGSTIRVTDVSSGAYTGSGVHTGSGCTRSGDFTANCSAAGVALIQVVSGDQTDKVTNSTAIKSSLNGGVANDLLTGGSAGDTMIGAAGADVFMGMSGNDDVRARDLTSDTTIDCGAGGADKADLDRIPMDPNSAVIDCETKTRH